METQTSNIF